MAILFAANSFAQNKKNTHFIPGEVWNDDEGNPINAHGGGIMYHQGIYYWFGEYKEGVSWKVPTVDWECYRVNAGGVSCYTSKDLLNWKFAGIALLPNTTDSANDIHISKVIERPKVIYNNKTKKFVMWMHIDSDNYLYARAGIATSDFPQGPYTYIESMRPNSNMSRDMTLFKDDDGKAYHIFSSEENATMHISLLDDTYTKSTGIFKRIFIDKSREAPAVFKRRNKYYIVSSGCTGWAPNAANIGSADNIMGDWKLEGNPCKGKDSDSTYFSQSTHVLPIQGKKDTFIFMADKWNKMDLQNSRYVWLPLRFVNNISVIEWVGKWNVNSLK